MGHQSEDVTSPPHHRPSGQTEVFRSQDTLSPRAEETLDIYRGAGPQARKQGHCTNAWRALFLCVLAALPWILALGAHRMRSRVPSNLALPSGRESSLFSGQYTRARGVQGSSSPAGGKGTAEMTRGLGFTRPEGSLAQRWAHKDVVLSDAEAVMQARSLLGAVDLWSRSVQQWSTSESSGPLLVKASSMADSSGEHKGQAQKRNPITSWVLSLVGPQAVGPTGRALPSAGNRRRLMPAAPWVLPAIDFVLSNWDSVSSFASPARDFWRQIVQASAANLPTQAIQTLLCNHTGPFSYFKCVGDELEALQLSYHRVSSSLELPPSLCQLSTLHQLDLSFNTAAAGASIPACLGDLSRLERLGLENMTLSGTVPASLGRLTNLNVLLLANNYLNGSIPSALSSLTNLTSLQLQYNELSGPVPLFLSSFTGLVRLYLYYNNLTGSIPSELGALTQLQELGIDHNPFFGSIPDALGNLRSLVILDLDRVNLQGTIPSSLGLLTNLRSIRIANNANLSGSIPASFNQLSSLVEANIFWNNLSGTAPPCWASFPNLTIINLGVKVGCPDGNNQVCCGGPPRFDSSLAFCQPGYCRAQYCETCILNLSPPPESSGGLPPAAIAGVVAGSLFAVLLALGVAAWLLWRRHVSTRPQAWERHLQSTCHRFSWEELLSATDNFSQGNFLGKGGFGSVHRGRMPDGTEVAVKRASRVEVGSAGRGKFEQEVVAVNQLCHGSLVRLLGYCSEGDERVLVYELMPGGALSEHLYMGSHEEPLLSLDQRLQAALDVAEGLRYLHGFAGVPLVHRDIKPENILLDASWRARIADFGLAKQLLAGGSVATSIAGTTGYMDPELLSSDKISAKADVYSFGVVLLEMITGLRCIFKRRGMARPASLPLIPGAEAKASSWRAGASRSGPLLLSQWSSSGQLGASAQQDCLSPAEGQEEDDGEDDVLHITVWAEPFVQMGRIAELADQRVCTEADLPEVLALAQLAMECVRCPGNTRPSMADVCSRLHKVARQRNAESQCSGRLEKSVSLNSDSE